jgi:hypothetical protein
VSIPTGLRRQFLEELKQLVALDGSPQLERILDYGEADGTLFLVTEEERGIDCSQLAASVAVDGPLPIEAVVRLVAEAVVGLQAVHERGLVHRAPTSRALVLLPSGQVRLRELGAAWLATELAPLADGALRSPFHLLAPELLDGAAQTVRSNLYAVGLWLFELLTGQPLLGQGDDAARAHALRAMKSGLAVERLRLLRSDLPHLLGDVVGRLLDSDPARRYPDAPALRFALERVQRSLPVAATQSTLAALARARSVLTSAPDPSVVGLHERSSSLVEPAEATVTTTSEGLLAGRVRMSGGGRELGEPEATVVGSTSAGALDMGSSAVVLDDSAAVALPLGATSGAADVTEGHPRVLPLGELGSFGEEPSQTEIQSSTPLLAVRGPTPPSELAPREETRVDPRGSGVAAAAEPKVVPVDQSALPLPAPPSQAGPLAMTPLRLRDGVSGFDSAVSEVSRTFSPTEDDRDSVELERRRRRPAQQEVSRAAAVSSLPGAARHEARTAGRASGSGPEDDGFTVVEPEVEVRTDPLESRAHELLAGFEVSESSMDVATIARLRKKRSEEAVPTEPFVADGRATSRLDLGAGGASSAGPGDSLALPNPSSAAAPDRRSLPATQRATLLLRGLTAVGVGLVLVALVAGVARRLKRGAVRPAPPAMAGAALPEPEEPGGVETACDTGRAAPCTHCADLDRRRSTSP